MIREFCLRQRSPSSTSNGCVVLMSFVAFAPKLSEGLSHQRRVAHRMHAPDAIGISIDINNKNTMCRGKAHWIHWELSSDAKKVQCEMSVIETAGLWVRFGKRSRPRLRTRRPPLPRDEIAKQKTRRGTPAGTMRNFST